MASKICFVCGLGDTKIINFTDESLTKCSEILEVRKKLKYKYSDLCLSVSSNIGYHLVCYRKFTALSTRAIQEEKASSTPSSTSTNVRTRSQSDSSLSSGHKSTGVLRKVCIFCRQERKEFKKVKQPLIPARTDKFEDKIREYASALNDFDLLAQIGGNFVAKEVHYHNICRLQYQKQFQKSAVPEQNEEKPTAKFHEVINAIIQFIRSNVIDGHQAFLLSALHRQFLLFYDEIMDGEECSYTAQHLEEKILKTFSDDILQISKLENKKVVHSPQLNSAQLHYLVISSNERLLLKEAAAKLRKVIMNIQPSTMPIHLKLEDIKRGEVEIPELLSSFLSNLIGGSDPRKHGERTERLVDSFAQDIIFATTNGRLKPSKHILLGMCMSGLTSSKKVINILNHYGHILSYSMLEGIETELCYSDIEASESRLLPSAMTTEPGLATGVAFDNFDRYVETVSGKDTLHDTVGIAYQISTSIPSNPPAICASQFSDYAPESKRRRRTFEGDTGSSTLALYKKKPKYVGRLAPLDLPERKVTPESLIGARYRDIIWMVSVAIGLHTPNWTGFNSRMFDDSTPMQKVYYLPPINQSPTSTSVVFETMKRAQEIASSCKQESILVTYDLAISKIAFQIQRTESPRFDNLFIQMGDFHTMMAFFHAVGKFIEGCGLSEILIDADVLAGGSVNGFITGKHFNRCKRIHPIAAVTLETLHFEKFLEASGLSVSPEMKSDIENIAISKEKIELSSELENLFEHYEAYYEETLTGKHGKTAQFYLIYIQLIKYYFIFSRSIREGDYYLYMYIIPKLTNIFFALNQPNYARWLVKYHENLMKISSTHPGLIPTVVQNGCFAIKRTSTAFSRSPVDLTLEQTINADAANKLTGISFLTNSISARQRWTRFHSIKADIISTVLEIAGLKKENDLKNDVKDSRIKKDGEAIKRLTESIRKHINPFDGSVNQLALFNVTTGKCAQEDTLKFLLNIEAIGETAKNAFITECSENENRFEKPIKRQKIRTFAGEQKKIVRKSVDGKLQEEMTNKNLFARMLATSATNKIDIVEVLKYPLTPTPRSLSHADGSFVKTDKSTLASHLETKVADLPHETPSFVDVTIIDGFFLLHTLGEIPRTFAQISKKFLQMVTQYKSSEIHLVFDLYLTPSIKNAERLRRTQHMQVEEVFVIHGPNQVRPINFINCLRSDTFKMNFVKFIIKHWQDSSLHPFFSSKRVIVNDGNTCYSFNAQDEIVHRTTLNLYSCQHEEADTRIFYIISKIQSRKNIVVRCNDTDVLIILLGNFHKVSKDSKIWIEAGLFKNNTLRYVNVNQIFNTLGEDLCRALPGFHAFTGCDTTSSFFNKGKLVPFRVMERSVEFVKYFKTFEYSIFTSTRLAEEFVCSLYGLRGCKTVNEGRYRKFELAYKPRKPNEPLIKSFSSFNSSCIPPCQSALMMHLRRSIYQAYIWHHADEENPTSGITPLSFGWRMEGNEYEPVWFEGAIAPPIVMNQLEKESFLSGIN